MRDFDQMGLWERLRLRWHIAFAKIEDYGELLDDPDDPLAHKRGVGGFTAYSMPSKKHQPQLTDEPDPFDAPFLDRFGKPDKFFDGY